MPIEILMPALSPTMTEGNLASWVKQEGDTVAPGDVIAEIETDKATMEVEAVEEGTIGKILVAAGTQNVAVNAPIALLLEEGEDASSLDNYEISSPASDSTETNNDSSANTDSKSGQTSEAAPTAQATPNATPAASFQPAPQAPTYPSTMSASASTSSAQERTQQGDRVVASPLARRIAQEKGIDIQSVIGTGPHGRIIRADVEDAAKSGSTGNRIMRHPIEFEAVTNDNMRKTIASRLLASKQHVPHFYLTIDCELDKLLDLRKDLNEEAVIQAGKDNPPSYKISVNDLVIKASAKALKRIPKANGSWTDDAILYYNNVDVSVAVAIDGGLITPVIRNADQKTIPAISHEMKELAGRARQGKLMPEEYQGGGFSISNLGMYGIKHFNAIINPPQACILAVGAGEERPVVHQGSVNIATVMTVTLSCDHRVVDGAVGAEFLDAFRYYIHHPSALLL